MTPPHFQWLCVLSWSFWPSLSLCVLCSVAQYMVCPLLPFLIGTGGHRMEGGPATFFHLTRWKKKRAALPLLLPPPRLLLALPRGVDWRLAAFLFHPATRYVTVERREGERRRPRRRGRRGDERRKRNSGMGERGREGGAGRWLFLLLTNLLVVFPPFLSFVFSLNEQQRAGWGKTREKRELGD